MLLSCAGKLALSERAALRFLASARNARWRCMRRPPGTTSCICGTGARRRKQRKGGMNKDRRNPDGATTPGPPVKPTVARVRCTDLLRGARELVIEHAGEEYRLRITSNGKLILTK